MNLVRKTFEQTQAAQITVSPEFTVCRSCHDRSVGLQDACGICESPDVFSLTRIVGYYSRINNWNKSKIGELKAKTEAFKARLTAGETLDNILPEAFATAREAGKRTLGMRHFDVQLMGGIVLHQGKIAEMKTGNSFIDIHPNIPKDVGAYSRCDNTGQVPE